MRASSVGIRSRVQRGSLYLSGFFSLLFAVDGRAVEEADFAVAARLPPGLPLPSTWPELALNEWAADAFQRRRARIAGVSSVEDVRVHQREARQFFLDQLGPWPERTPLQPRVVGSLERPEFRLEKVIFESRPGFLVTASLYLPKTEGPVPGVLVPCGHSQNGKAESKYQRASMLLAANGIAALCFDPIGQGERKQVLAADHRPAFHATEEHMVLGPACVLLGENLASWMIWDGMRALDYLGGRPEVDANRLGCSGNSGGGTQTSYLMALDDRIQCAAPSCYLTSFEHLLGTIGPQDAEQNIHGQISYGLDHADYLLMRAPKPTLICAATEDFFPIEGTWQSFREAKRTWARLGFPERIDLVEVDEKHGFHQPLREAMVGWMRRWLIGADDHVVEPELPVFSDAELQCTEHGQVAREDGARSIFELQRERADGIRVARREPALEGPVRARRRAFGESGARGGEPRKAGWFGEFSHGDRTVRRLLLQAPDASRGDVDLPAVLSAPPRTPTRAMLVVHDHGKAAGFEAALSLATDETLILAVDLRGVGELEAQGRRGDYAKRGGPNWADVLYAYLLGRSYVDLRAGEIEQCARWLRHESGELPAQAPIELMASGELGVAALHAAALGEEAIARLHLERALVSWDEVIGTPYPQDVWEEVVHGALLEYDLPDLRAALGDRLVETKPRSAARR